MKKLKYLIITFIFIIIIIICMLFAIMKQNDIPEENNNVENLYENILEEELELFDKNENLIAEKLETATITRVKDNKIFYTIENCVKKFEMFVNLNYEEQINELNQPSIAAEYGIYNKDDKAKAILKFLDRVYVKSNNIDESNVLQQVNATQEDYKVEALKINKLNSNSDIKTYSVYAKKTINNIDSYIYYIVKIGDEERFCIYPINGNSYNDLDDIELKDTIEYIETNDINTYVRSNMTESLIATRYFQEYKELMLNNLEEAYNKLDVEYRNKRFGSIDEFKNYINSNRENIELMQVYRYGKEENDYIIKDRYENIYIFHENAPKEYTVKLDEYTIQSKEYKEAYNDGTDEAKINENLKKIVLMINNKDYKNLYSLLNKTFKENNYNTLEYFISTIKNRLFDISRINSIETSKNGDNYICNLQLSDYKYNSEDIISIQIIIKLKEGTDFEMSFSFE